MRESAVRSFACRRNLSIALVSCVGLYLYIARPAVATDNERAVLRVAVQAFRDKPAFCISLFTSFSLVGYGYMWRGSNDDRINAKIQSALNNSSGRKRTVLVRGWENISVISVLGNIFGRAECIMFVTLETPRFSGDYAFVDFRENYRFPFEGTIALHRRGGEWKRIGSQETMIGGPISF